MKHFAMLLAGLALTGSTLAIWAADEPKKADAPKVPEVKVETVKQAPKIDGTLDDEVWKSAATYTAFKNADGKESKIKTKMYVAQDDKALYIAVECFEDAKALKNITAEVKDHDGDLWTDDSIEVFVDPAGKKKDYYQIIINSKGTTYDAYLVGEGGKESDVDWNPKYQSAAKVGKESWVAEFAFPWSIFTKTPKMDTTWGFNVLRNRPGDADLLWFAPIDGSAHQPESFGKLTGVAPKAAAAAETKPAAKE
jgi:hypothetical protein